MFLGISVLVSRVIVGGTGKKQDDNDVFCLFVTDCCVALLLFFPVTFFVLPFEEEREQEVAANIKEFGQNFPPCQGLIGGSMAPLSFGSVSGNFLSREKHRDNNKGEQKSKPKKQTSRQVLR